MAPPDYYPDARRILADDRHRFLEILREARDAAGYNNAALWRDVRAIVEAHNAVPGRTEILGPRSLAGKPDAYVAKYQMSAIRNGTHKYIPGYLAWLCRDHETKARAFYESIGLPFRPYEETAPEPKTAPTARYTSWNELIDAYGRFTNVDIRSMADTSIGLVVRPSGEPVAERRLRLNEPFHFQLEAPADGCVVGFQRYRGVWYPLPLVEDGFAVRIERGSRAIPSDPESGAPMPLEEHVDDGEHGFAFLIADDELRGLTADFVAGGVLPRSSVEAAHRLIAALPVERQVIYRINVMFEG